MIFRPTPRTHREVAGSVESLRPVKGFRGIKPTIKLSDFFHDPLTALRSFHDLPDCSNKPGLEDRAPLGVKDAPMTVLRPPFFLHQLVADRMS